jgi:hypothetical protein
VGDLVPVLDVLKLAIIMTTPFRSIVAALGLILFHHCNLAQEPPEFRYTIEDGSVTIERYTGLGGAVTLPGSIEGMPVTTIGEAAFDRHLGLISISIPDSVMTIRDSAFAQCTNLTSVTIPDGIVTIGAGAFQHCYSLKRVSIPKSLTSIGHDAFGWCINLTEIVVTPSNPSFSSLDGVLFDKRQTVLIRYPQARQFGDYTIPDTVTSIANSAFEGCGNLTGIVISDSVSVIGDMAFTRCNRLANVQLGNRVTSIGEHAFSGCHSLITITIPDSVRSIERSAFWYCRQLTSVTIGNGLTSIGDWVFRGCRSLTTVTIGDSIESIGELAFSLTWLEAVYFRGNRPTEAASSLFRHTDSVTVYYLTGTTGWDTTFGDRPTVLWNPILHAPGVQPDGFRLEITGTANIPIMVEASTRFAEAVWVPLYSGTLTDGSLTITDPAWTNHSVRFYRVRSRP